MPTADELNDAELRQRMEQLIKEPSVPPPAAPPRSARQTKQASSPIKLGLAIGLALLVGVQLGSLPWRFRREIWQIQGALVGVALGVVIGRYSARRPE
ncbi:MAG: hypothetical protein WD136_04790 [Cyanobium sp.]